MGTGNQVVARFNDGRVVKGYTNGFSSESKTIMVQEVKSGNVVDIPVAELKALYFIKSFDGDEERRERKAFGINANTGRKVYIKFNDRESLVGFIEGEIPWSKGFFLSKERSKANGFFVVPADSNSNNDKVFVVGSSIKDVTVMVK